MVSGMFLLAYGSVIGIEAALGVAPWHVLHIGLTNHLPLTVGRAAQFSGFFILAVAMILGVRPRFGTFVNMASVGYFMDVIIAYHLVPPVNGLFWRSFYVVLGVVIAGFGVACYICADLGTGPRDSLMLGVTRKVSWRVGTIRSSIEISVVFIGFLLGGPVGIGTLVAAVMTGPIVEWSMALLSQLAKLRHLNQIIKIPASARIGRKAPAASAPA